MNNQVGLTEAIRLAKVADGLTGSDFLTEAASNEYRGWSEDKNSRLTYIRLLERMAMDSSEEMDQFFKKLEESISAVLAG